MYYTIYKITCKTTGRIYIGKHQTKNLNDNYMGSGKILGRAKKKYGLENFTKEILYVFETEQEMNQKETELVTEEFCHSEDTFNLCPGGQGGWGFININSLSVRNITKSNAKELSAKANSKKSHKWNSDDSFRESYSKNLSAANKGKNNPNYGKHYINNGTDNILVDKNEPIPEGWRLGRIYLNEWRNSLSEKTSGKNNSQYGKKFKFVNDGKINKKVPIECVDDFINLGYTIGKLRFYV
jgi:hypothetical protein